MIDIPIDPHETLCPFIQDIFEWDDDKLELIAGMATDITDDSFHIRIIKSSIHFIQHKKGGRLITIQEERGDESFVVI